MWNDPIVDEIHSVRARIWKDCGYDFDKLVERLRTREAKHSERLVYPQIATRMPRSSIDANTVRRIGSTDITEVHP